MKKFHNNFVSQVLFQKPKFVLSFNFMIVQKEPSAPNT